MKGLKQIVVLLLVVFVGIQFIPTTHNQSTVILTSNFLSTYKVPKDIQKLLKNSCYDCHSNNTNYPWYNKIQPASWFLEHHIKEGKNELNFDEFGNYSLRKQKSKLKSIVTQIEDRKMPLSSYTLIHKEAKLSDSERIKILEWITKKQDSINNK